MSNYVPQQFEEGLSFLQSEIISLIRQGIENPVEIAKLVGCDASWVRKTKKMHWNKIDTPDAEQVINRKHLVNAQLQKARDSLRVERKAFREEVRYYNTTTELYEEVAAILQDTHGDFNTIHHEDHARDTEGIVQISDIHFNEIIELPYNTFDFTVAAKRLKKLITRAKIIFNAHGVKTVHVPFTGDMLNSDRRLDEVMTAATNRAKASVLAAMVLKQVLLDLNEDYNVKTYMVTGNESRINKEPGNSEIMATDNFDSLIHEMLRMMFLDKEGIEFIDGSPIEQIMRVKRYLILLIHGHQMKMSGISSQMQRLKGKWSDYLTNETINYALFGHFHTSRITDLFARSGGVCGANAYSDNKLMLSSRASQNIFLVDDDGIDGIKIDLQNADEYNGYNIDKALEAYKVKSATPAGYAIRKRI